MKCTHYINICDRNNNNNILYYTVIDVNIYNMYGTWNINNS